MAPYEKYAKFTFVGNSVDKLVEGVFEFVRKPHIGHVTIKDNVVRDMSLGDAGLEEATEISGNQLDCGIHICSQLLGLNKYSNSVPFNPDDPTSIVNFYKGFSCKPSRILPTTDIPNLISYFKSPNDCLHEFVKWEVKTAVSDASQIKTTICDSNGDQKQFEEVSGCGGLITSSNGLLSSENYPQHYASRLSCLWKIRAHEGHRIKVTFTDLEMEGNAVECQYDYVQIRDGSEAEAHILGKYCGDITLLPQEPIISTSNNLQINFQTDRYYNVMRGFQLKYETICGQIFTAQSAEFSSPNYPQQYSNNLECEYYIEVQPEQTITMEFTHIDVESHPNCILDYVEVYDGPSESTHMIGRFCGTDVPVMIQSTNNSLFIRFHSDGSIGKQGFWASYYIQVISKIK